MRFNGNFQVKRQELLRITDLDFLSIRIFAKLWLLIQFILFEIRCEIYFLLVHATLESIKSKCENNLKIMKRPSQNALYNANTNK